MTSPSPDVLASAEPGPVMPRIRIIEAAIRGGTRRVPSTEAAWGAISV